MNDNIVTQQYTETAQRPAPAAHTRQIAPDPRHLPRVAAAAMPANERGLHKYGTHPVLITKYTGYS